MTKAIELADKLELEWKNNELDYDTALDSSIELRRLAAVEQENAKLVKELAESKLHALNGWQRYDMANRMSNSLQQELADLKAAMGEPVAWDVYVECADNGYLVDSLDDPQLIDDCTNHDAVVTPLYAIKAAK